MKPFPGPLVVLACAGAAAGQRLSVRPERPRCYGSGTIVARVRAPDGVRSLLWEASVAEAPIQRGRVSVRKDGGATLSVRTPGVKRACDMTVRVQTAAGTLASCVVRVFPVYDGSRLRRLCASARLGVAEVGDELSSRLVRFGCRYDKAGGRLALGLFEGDVLVASGAWWAGEGRFAAGLLRGHLARGARIVVLECAGGGLSFSEPPKDCVARHLAIADRQHPVSKAPGLDSGWGEVPALVPDLAGNFRRLVVDGDGERPVIVEAFPPEGGALLLVSLPVLSRFERDPAAAVLFEHCLAWAVDFEAPEWKGAVFCLAGADEVAERLAGLGVRGAEELRDEAEGIVLAARGQLTREACERIRSGGTAALLVPGSCAAPPGSIADDPATRGLSPGRVKRLCAPAPDDDAWELPALGGKRRTLVAGFLDRVELGAGKAYVLRVGPLDDEMTRPWREFLLQVLTNLGVTCGEVDADE